jgi:hypothetical protein
MATKSRKGSFTHSVQFVLTLEPKIHISKSRSGGIVPPHLSIQAVEARAETWISRGR